MKRVVLAFSTSFAFILGCVAATYAPQMVSPTSKADGSEGRYRCGLKVDGISMSKSAYAAKLEASLNAQGGPGWRIALHDDTDGVVCFERI